MDLLALTHIPGLTTGKFYRVDEDINDKDRYLVYNDVRAKVSLPKYYFGTYEDYKDEKSFEERYSSYKASNSSSMFTNIDAFSDAFKAIVEKDQSENNGGSTDYYKIDSKWKDLQDIIEDRNMSYAQANIAKVAFTFNVGRHEGTDELRDINKIIYFAERIKQEILKKQKND